MKQLLENLWLDNLDGDLSRHISSYVFTLSSCVEIAYSSEYGTPGLKRMMMDSNNLLIGFL
jgi:hypothetical protein